MAAVAETERSHRRRVAEMPIAATAHANQLSLYARNPDRFAGMTTLVKIIAV